MASIDLDKVSVVLDFLREKEAGHKLLEKFGNDMDSLQSNFPSQLNRHEFMYVMRTLINQMRVEESADQLVFDDDVKGLLFGKTPGLVQKLGENLKSTEVGRMLPHGFMIMPTK